MLCILSKSRQAVNFYILKSINYLMLKLTHTIINGMVWHGTAWHVTVCICINIIIGITEFMNKRVKPMRLSPSRSTTYTTNTYEYIYVRNLCVNCNSLTNTHRHADTSIVPVSTEPFFFRCNSIQLARRKPLHVLIRILHIIDFSQSPGLRPRECHLS